MNLANISMAAKLASIEKTTDAAPQGDGLEKGVQAVLAFISGKAAQAGPTRPVEHGSDNPGDTNPSKHDMSHGPNGHKHFDNHGKPTGPQPPTAEASGETQPQQLDRAADKYREAGRDMRVQSVRLHDEAQNLRDQSEVLRKAGDVEGAEKLIANSKALDSQAQKLAEASRRAYDTADHFENIADRIDMASPMKPGANPYTGKGGSGHTAGGNVAGGSGHTTGGADEYGPNNPGYTKPGKPTRSQPTPVEDGGELQQQRLHEAAAATRGAGRQLAIQSDELRVEAQNLRDQSEVLRKAGDIEGAEKLIENSKALDTQALILATRSIEAYDAADRADAMADSLGEKPEEPHMKPGRGDKDHPKWPRGVGEGPVHTTGSGVAGGG